MPRDDCIPFSSWGWHFIQYMDFDGSDFMPCLEIISLKARNVCVPEMAFVFLAVCFLINMQHSA